MTKSKNASTSKFKVGDRVVWFSTNEDADYANGKKGIVVDGNVSSDERVAVKYDEGEILMSKTWGLIHEKVYESPLWEALR